LVGWFVGFVVGIFFGGGVWVWVGGVGGVWCYGGVVCTTDSETKRKQSNIKEPSKRNGAVGGLEKYKKTPTTPRATVEHKSKNWKRRRKRKEGKQEGQVVGPRKGQHIRGGWREQTNHNTHLVRRN